MSAAPAPHMGLTFASFSGLGPQSGFQAAEWAHQLGYHSFWVAETTGTEAFSTLAAIGAAQPSLDLGTGVLAVQLRTPPLTAMGAATLAALHPNRDILLGIGISSPTVVNRWHGADYGEKALARMREEITLLRLCLSGEKVDFAGDFHSVKGFRLGVRLGENKPKIIVGALNEKMLQMAGELADGVLLNYLPASHVPWSVEQIRKGGNAKVYAYIHVGVTDPEQHRDLGRKDLYSYIVVDSYAKNFTRAGFGDEVAEVRARFANGDREGAVKAVSDNMVDAIDVLGDSAHIHHTVQSYVDAGVEVPVIMPMPWGGDRLSVIEKTMQAAVGQY